MALLCGIGLGLLAGRMVWGGKDVEAAAHNTSLIVYPDGEIYVLTKKNQTITWVTPNPNGGNPIPFKVHFTDSSPCKEGMDVSTCHIDKNLLGTFLYTCLDSQGKEFCKDPGVDPNSSTEPPSPSGGEPRAGTPVLANDVADVTFRLSCRSGNVVSTQTGGDSNVTKGIFWAYSGFKPEFKVDPLAPQLCTTLAENYGGGKLCKAAGPASGNTYKITVTGGTTCGGQVVETVVH